MSERSDRGQDRVSVVVVTKDRRDQLIATLGRLAELPERPPVIVVDDASADGTAAAVRAACPQVEVVRLDRSRGAAGRTEGVRRAGTPYVAFCDDDSAWEPGALRRAADIFDAHPRLGLIAARVLVGEDGRLDPVSEATAASPLAGFADVGPGVLGFLACGGVVRVAAYLQVGGFHPRFGVGGEETLLALDLTEAGWQCCYSGEVVARHFPAPRPATAARRERQVRNELWTTWLRRRGRSAVPETLRAVRTGEPRVAIAALREAATGLPWVLAGRRPLNRSIERDLALLSRSQ